MKRGHFLTEENLYSELQKIVLEDYGIALNKEQVLQMGQQLTDLFENLVYGEEVKKNEKTKNKKGT